MILRRRAAGIPRGLIRVRRGRTGRKRARRAPRQAANGLEFPHGLRFRAHRPADPPRDGDARPLPAVRPRASLYVRGEYGDLVDRGTVTLSAEPAWPEVFDCQHRRQRLSRGPRDNAVGPALRPDHCRREAVHRRASWSSWASSRSGTGPRYCACSPTMATTSSSASSGGSRSRPSTAAAGRRPFLCRRSTRCTRRSMRGRSSRGSPSIRHGPRRSATRWRGRGLC